jgi:hypothetical protein
MFVYRPPLVDKATMARVKMPSEEQTRQNFEIGENVSSSSDETAGRNA